MKKSINLQTRNKSNIMTTFNKIINIETVDSTNNYVKERILDLENGTVLFSSEQTNGRGRFERSWFGEKHKSVFSSFLIKDISEPEDALRFSFLFSLGIKNLLKQYIPEENIVLKWPNDILIGNKKICGVLSEFAKNCIIVGIGINVLDFAPDGKIESPWTTIEKETKLKLDVETFKFELIDHINNAFVKYNADDPKQITKVWAEQAEILGKFVTVTHGHKKISGTVLSIDDLGMLKLLHKDNIINISTGDLEYND
ncbi:MAG: biotin--[acetyl-CoA-carboxylase] ligase [Candidatus Delongbacteria bacterium]|jgi:BirA family biotin operon repressor/biotin-[acetyl-CoA-carboxylase] ligase|nr:biotin--[acetyl-CoA-carboxylase] ligase [Candidatus Delongbacteria bacterium]